MKFDPTSLSVTRTSKGYAVTERNKTILHIGDSRPEARLAMHLMQHYSMNKFCRVTETDPEFSFFTSANKSPRGAVGGEDCVAFNPKKVRHVKKGDRYFLVERSHSIAALGPNERAAKKVRDAVRDYGFKNICFIGRPNPSMVYFRR
ncbi:MAG: hypothetical protein V3S44_06415 [Alphaproteobacteria bacterium]